MKGKELHMFGAFIDSFLSKSTEVSELIWLSKLRINQVLLKSKQEHDSTHMVALMTRSSCTLPRFSPPSKHDHDKSSLFLQL